MAMRSATNNTSELLIDELPSVTALGTPRDASDAFIKIRKWVERLHSQGKLAHAGDYLSLEHRSAILTFLEQEASSGIRRKLAKPLLDILKTEETWLRQPPQIETENAPPTGTKSEKLPPAKTDQPRVVAGASRCELGHDRPQDDVHIALPALNTLMHRDATEDPQEDFELIRVWVRQRRRQGNFGEAWAALSRELRSEIKDFLNYFSEHRPVFREQAREVLTHISAVDKCPSKVALDDIGFDDANVLLKVQPSSEDGEEIANLSNWIMRLSDTDVAAAGVGLPVAARRDIFELLLRACQRRRSRVEARKVISKLLRSETWSREGFLDTVAMRKMLDKSIDTHALEVATSPATYSAMPHCMSFLRAA